MCDWPGQVYNRLTTVVSSGGVDGKMCDVLVLTRMIQVRILLLGEHIFLPLQISNHIRKAFINQKPNNQKVGNKVLFRVGVGRALLSH